MTEEGASEWSDPLTVETPYEQTEMGRLRDDVFGGLCYVLYFYFF